MMKLERGTLARAGAMAVTFGVAGCNLCGRSDWDGPIPTGSYPVEEVWVGTLDAGMEEALSDTLTLEFSKGQLLELTYVDPDTGAEVVVQYEVVPRGGD